MYTFKSLDLVFGAKDWKKLHFQIWYFYSTFCLVDEEGTCIPVNVYNIAQGSGVKIGDSVAIAEPFVQRISVNHNNIVSFSSVDRKKVGQINIRQILIGFQINMQLPR